MTDTLEEYAEAMQVLKELAAWSHKNRKRREPQVVGVLNEAEVLVRYRKAQRENEGNV